MASEKVHERKNIPGEWCSAVTITVSAYAAKDDDRRGDHLHRLIYSDAALR